MTPKNPLSWGKTRPHYVRYMKAKKARNKALKEFNAARQAIIAVAKQYLTTAMTRSMRASIDAIVSDFFVDDVDAILDKVEIDITHSVELPVRFVKARSRYAKSLKDLNETYEAAEVAEKAYNDAVYLALHRDYNFSLRRIADVFGKWVSTQKKEMDSYEDDEEK